MRHFTLKDANSINEMAEKFKNGEEVILNQSDLAIQSNEYFLQFKLSEKEEGKNKVLLKTGVYNIESGTAGPQFIEMPINEPEILEISDAYKKIEHQFSLFFDRLDIYRNLKISPLKRGVLLYGPPGTGKTASTTKALLSLIKKDGTAAVFWNTSSVRSSDILNLFTTGIEYGKDVKRLIVVIEDIGMGVEGYGGPKEIDRSMLNLLDGAGASIQVPTFFVATTNYAHNLPEPLLRPGRFDNYIEVGVPSAEERVKLVEFFIEESLSEEDRAVIMSKDLKDFSIAQVRELVIRTKIDDKGYAEVVADLKKLKDKFNKGFENSNSRGLGLNG